MKDLTVLLAYKDRRKNLEYCLSSINNCDPRPPKVVLVDFGSDQPVRYLEEQYSWLRVIDRINNTSVFHKSRALNIGIKKIHTKYICATDVDQIFSNNFFSVVLNTLQLGGKLVMCKTHEVKTALPKWFKKPVTKDVYNRLLASIPKRKLRGEGCCLGFPTKWARKVRGWDERYIGYGAEDSDFMLRATLSGLDRVWVQKQTSLIHLPHEKTSVYYATNVFKRNKQIYLARKNVKKDTVVNTDIVWGTL